MYVCVWPVINAFQIIGFLPSYWQALNVKMADR